eukprot:6271297-Amphidinium_carterae.1
MFVASRLDIFRKAINTVGVSDPDGDARELHTLFVTLKQNFDARSNFERTLRLPPRPLQPPNPGISKGLPKKFEQYSPHTQIITYSIKKQF